MDQNILKERLAVHEASHAVVAKLFEDNLHLKMMTFAEESENIADTEGAKTLGMIGVVGKEHLWVAPGVVSLAGMVGEAISTQSPTQVLQNKEAILKHPDQHINILLGGGDFILFKLDAQVNAWHYGTEEDYEALCLSFLIDFLCSSSVWPVVQQLKEAVLKKRDLTLNEQELEALFDSAGYATYIKEQKKKLLEQFQKKVETDSLAWQFDQMIKGSDVNLFNDEIGS